jgi:hypothetical protein
LLLLIRQCGICTKQSGEVRGTMGIGRQFRSEDVQFFEQKVSVSVCSRLKCVTSAFNFFPFDAKVIAAGTPRKAYSMPRPILANAILIESRNISRAVKIAFEDVWLG